MFDRLLDHFLAEPRRFIALGSVLVRSGGFLFVAGLAAQVATTATAMTRGLATGARPEVGLAEVFPGFLSWWMPETVWGFGLALLMVVAGITASCIGRSYERMLRY